MNKKLFNVHPDVLKLGIVSFLTDISSEAIFSVFSIFFTVVVGASASLLGLIEGFSDFSASSLDYFAGWLSDRSGARKRYALIGYGFSTLAKLMLLIGTSVATKRPSLPVTLYTPSGLADGMTGKIKFSGKTSKFFF